LVCNCHEDSKLMSVIRLVEKVYGAESEEQMESLGAELQDAIGGFLKEFLHHMQEEEDIFQPLLAENFNQRELADMHETVLKQHNLFREKVKAEKNLQAATKRRRTEEVFEQELDFGNLEDLG